MQNFVSNKLSMPNIIIYKLNTTHCSNAVSQFQLVSANANDSNLSYFIHWNLNTFVCTLATSEFVQIIIELCVIGIANFDFAYDRRP